MKIRYVIIPILCLAAIALSSCSSGGGGQATSPPEETATTLNGMVSKGPIAGATVKVFAISGGAVDATAPVVPVQTDDNGAFSMDLGSFQGAVLIEVTGGSFTDEVSGLSVSLNAPLHTIMSVAPQASTITAAVTPMTELAYRKAKGSGALTAEAIDAANASIASTFGLGDIVSTLPRSDGGSAGQKKYAAACGAFSQLLNDNKGPGESLDNALTRLIGKMGDEEEQGGKLSTDSTVMMNGAISNFSGSASNTTGATLDALSLPASGLLVLSTAGAPSIMAGIDVAVSLPAGVILDADPITGETTPGVVSVSGEAAVGGNNLSVAKYTPAFVGSPASLHIVLVNAKGFRLGEFVNVKFDLATGAGFPVSKAFTVTSFSAKALDSSALSGISAVSSIVAGN